MTKKAFVVNKNEQIDRYENPDAWMFDFRRVVMNGEYSKVLGDVFWETFEKEYPFQLCALEIAGVPIVTSLMKDGYERGHKDMNAFFIRKSRKKNGLMRMIEGTVEKDKKIILVDDLMNSGDSFWRQIEVLEELGHKVDTVWAILRFRDLDFYKRFDIRGIQVKNVFTLDDFTKELGDDVKNIKNKLTPIVKNPFKVAWKFKSDNPTLSHVIPKSQPVIDDARIYFGADNRTFWALNQKDGTVAWQFQVGPGSDGKAIFSSPALYKNLVIFGAYDGAVYALDKNTGKKVWEYLEADWVGSSPAIDEKRGAVFIGLEFGLFNKRGGIVALHTETGKRLWIDKTHPALTHSSPLFIKEHNQVVIGSNDGVVRLYDARDGKLIWTFTTFGGASYDSARDGGFGGGAIKSSFAYDKKRDYVVFGSCDSFLYILDRKTGRMVSNFKCTFDIWNTPYIWNNYVYFTSLDKHVRCLDLNTLKLLWEKSLDKTRIFADPIVIGDKLYVGTNAARLHELDPNSGESLGVFQTVERITNHLVWNQKTNGYFLPTYANEVVKLERVK